MATLAMYDGVSGDAVTIARTFPRDPVACYINGSYAWSPAQEHMFGRKIRISVEAGQPAAAKYARVIDVETGAARPGDVLPFVQERKRLGFGNATIYCSLSSIRPIMDAAGADVFRENRLWAAWYWGGPAAPTLAQVKAEAQRYGLPAGIEPWACQWAAHAQWDVSAVYGVPDFSR